MTHKIIKTDNYLLVVSDEEIKRGDYIYDYSQLGKIYKAQNNYSKKDIDIYWVGKIASHLPFNGSPLLEGVDLLPALEDVQQLANEEYPDSIVKTIAYKKGYNKAREKYKYTEEDVNILSERTCEWLNDGFVNRKSLPTIEELKQWFILNQPLHQYPTEFECEEQIDYMDKNGFYFKSVKTTTINGRKVWVGKYK